MKRDAAKRRISLAVCVFFMAGTLLSAAFVFTHLHHEHDHHGPDGGCAACVYLAASVNLLEFISATVLGALCGFKTFSAIVSPLKFITFQRDFFTLVRLKIRLNY